MDDRKEIYYLTQIKKLYNDVEFERGRKDFWLTKYWDEHCHDANSQWLIKTDKLLAEEKKSIPTSWPDCIIAVTLIIGIVCSLYFYWHR